MEPRLILKMVEDQHRSERPEEDLYSSLRKSSRASNHERSHKILSVWDEKQMDRLPDVQREFRRFKQKLILKPTLDENIEVLQPRTSNNRSCKNLGKIYSKEKHQYESRREDLPDLREGLLQKKRILKLEAEIERLNNCIRQLQIQKAKLSENLDVLQKTIQFGYGELDSKNELLARLREAIVECGLLTKQPVNFKECIDEFVEGYRQRDRFVGLCTEMVQSVLQNKKERPSIKKCWRMLKGIVEEYERSQQELTQLELLKKKFQCQTISEMAAFVQLLTTKTKCSMGLRKDSSLRMLKDSLQEQPNQSAKTRKPLRHHFD